MRVSIPRRYAKNTGTCVISSPFRVFQSLVGTLKTGQSIAGVVRAVTFQSLVGTLKTELMKEIPDDFIDCFNPS